MNIVDIMKYVEMEGSCLAYVRSPNDEFGLLDVYGPMYFLDVQIYLTLGSLKDYIGLLEHSV